MRFKAPLLVAAGAAAVLASGGVALAATGADQGYLSATPATVHPGDTVKVWGSCPADSSLQWVGSRALVHRPGDLYPGPGGSAVLTKTGSDAFAGTARIDPRIKPGRYTAAARCEGAGPTATFVVTGR